MKLERSISGCSDVETAENVEALIFLLHNAKDTYSFIVGPKNLVHKLFIECSLRWPIVGWEEEIGQKILEVLEPNVSDDTSTIYHISKDLINGEYETRGSGNIGFSVKEARTQNGSILALNISGIDDTLISAWSSGKALVGANGWGSEKRELMFYGAEVLFGPNVSYQLREAVLGRREVDLGDGKITQIDLTNLARKSLDMWRNHKAEPGEIILSAEMWEKLAEERARSGKIEPSVN